MKPERHCEAHIIVDGAPKRPCIRVANKTCDGCLSWLCDQHLPKENHDCAELEIEKRMAPELNATSPKKLLYSLREKLLEAEKEFSSEPDEYYDPDEDEIQEDWRKQYR